MKVVEIGKIGAIRNGQLVEPLQLPTTGIIIEATEKELADMVRNLLYKQVYIEPLEDRIARR